MNHITEKKIVKIIQEEDIHLEKVQAEDEGMIIEVIQATEKHHSEDFIWHLCKSLEAQGWFINDDVLEKLIALKL